MCVCVCVHRYNADGVALDDVATGADRDKIETPLVHWPGLPKHWVTHWEEVSLCVCVSERVCDAV